LRTVALSCAMGSPPKRFPAAARCHFAQDAPHRLLKLP